MPVLFYSKTYDINNAKADSINATETQLNIGLSEKKILRKSENRNRVLIEKRESNPQNKAAINQFRYRHQNSIAIPVKTFSAINKLNCVVINENFLNHNNLLQAFTKTEQVVYCNGVFATTGII